MSGSDNVALATKETKEMTAGSGVNSEFKNQFPVDIKLDTVSKLEFTEAEMKILYEPFDEDDLDILPHNGIVYAPWIAYMKRMRAAFKGSWALVPHGLPRIEDKWVVWPHYLFIKGHLMTYSIGECGYVPSNKQMSWGDSVEGSKSNALMRVCKAIGVGVETWDRKFLESWKKKNAEQREVFYDGKQVMHWFRKDGTMKHLYLRLVRYLLDLLDISEKSFVAQKGKVTLELCKEDELSKFKMELETRIKNKFYPKPIKDKINKSKVRADMIIKITKHFKNKANLKVKLMEFNISDMNKASDTELRAILNNIGKPAKKQIEKKKPENSLEDLMNQAEKLAKQKGFDTKMLNDLTKKICEDNLNKGNLKKVIQHLETIKIGGNKDGDKAKSKK